MTLAWIRNESGWLIEVIGGLEEVERRHVEHMVRRESGNIDRATARLGVSRSTLYQKLKRYREESS